jgi:PDZ domain
MSWSNLRGATEWALVVCLVFGAGAIAQAQDDAKSDGNVVKIGRPDEARPNLPTPGDEDDESRPAPPKYWIGLLGGPIPADNPLRAHVDLPENTGLLVANIVPKSPAAKAGLKQYDILLKGNDKDLREMKDLVDLVMSEGGKKGQITLDVLRHNKHETINLKPEERPADVETEQGEVGGSWGPYQPRPGDPFGRTPGMPRPGGPMQFNFRNFGPGVIVGGEPFAGLPNGVSIRVEKKNDQPPHITIQRGNDKWEITGDDPEALKKLPDDLRPAVERMLHGGGLGGGIGGFGLGAPGFPPQVPNMGPGMDSNRLREQLERMEKRLDEMQRRMLGPENQPADKSNDKQERSK